MHPPSMELPERPLLGRRESDADPEQGYGATADFNGRQLTVYKSTEERIDEIRCNSWWCCLGSGAAGFWGTVFSAACTDPAPFVPATCSPYWLLIPAGLGCLGVTGSLMGRCCWYPRALAAPLEAFFQRENLIIRRIPDKHAGGK